MTLLSIRDQQVNFRVVDGRVYHQNMEFQVGDVTLRSQGSVGLDETISLTLQVPIQDAWIAKEPLLAGLKGQSLQVPVTGTLTRPQMDQRAISSLTHNCCKARPSRPSAANSTKRSTNSSSRGDKYSGTGVVIHEHAFSIMRRSCARDCC